MGGGYRGSRIPRTGVRGLRGGDNTRYRVNPRASLQPAHPRLIPSLASRLSAAACLQPPAEAPRASYGSVPRQHFGPSRLAARREPYRWAGCITPQPDGRATYRIGLCRLSMIGSSGAVVLSFADIRELARARLAALTAVEGVFTPGKGRSPSPETDIQRGVTSVCSPDRINPCRVQG